MYFLQINFKKKDSSKDLVNAVLENGTDIDQKLLKEASYYLPEFAYLVNSITSSSSDMHTLYGVVAANHFSVYSKSARKEVMIETFINAMIETKIISSKDDIANVKEVEIDEFDSNGIIRVFAGYYIRKNSSIYNTDGYFNCTDWYRNIPSYISYENNVSTGDYTNDELYSFNNKERIEALLSGSKDKKFYAHKGIYKVLVRSKKDLNKVIDPLVARLYEKGDALSENYSVFNLTASMVYENISNIKIDNIKSLNIGGTLVILVGMPNIMYNDLEETEEPDTMEYQKYSNFSNEDEEDDNPEDDEPRNEDSQERREIKDKLRKMYKDYTEKMNKYDLCRRIIKANYTISDLQFSRDALNSMKMMKEQNLKSLMETSSVLHALIKMITNSYKYINIILAYSDTMAYEKNEFFQLLIPSLIKDDAGIIPLGDPVYYKSKERLDYFAKSTLQRFLGTEIIDEEYQYLYEKIKDHFIRMSKIDDVSTYHLYSSIPSMSYVATLLLEDEYNASKDNKDVEYDEATIKAKNIVENTETKKEEPTKETSQMIMQAANDFTHRNNSKSLTDLFIPNFEDFDESNIETETPNKRYRDKNDNSKTDVASIDDMIGLETIKENIKDFAALMKINQIKEQRELKTIIPSKHMIFKGNPGTAKTTTAMLLAHELYENGTLVKDNVLVVSRDQLVGKYVGWTAKNVAKYILDAKGGILFIDEAYSLVESYNSYGQEAIDTFVRYMDDKQIRETTIFIFAGYKKEMDEFIKSNPGIRSRIGFTWEFPDYTTEELLDIAKLQANMKNIVLSPEYLELLKESIEVYKNDRDFGNGRFVRSVLEKSLLKQARRLYSKYTDNVDAIKDTELLTLTAKDFSTTGIKSKEAKKIGF